MITFLNRSDRRENGIMAKCAICGKKIGLFSRPIKLYDEVVCQDCWKRLGFNEEDKEKYKYKAAAFLSRGKAECEAIIAEDERKKNALREYTYTIVGTTYDNENGKPIQKLLKKFLADQCDEKYDGYTNKDIKEAYDYDIEYWEYPETDTDCSLVVTEYEGKPAIKVYAEIPEKKHIGWIPKEAVSDVIDMVKKHKCDFALTVYGGKYKKLDMDQEDLDADYMPKDVVITDEKDYGASITISYDSDAPAPADD